MPRIVTITQHAVFATLADGSKHRVSEWMDWSPAITRWEAMDDQRRDAHKDKGIIAYKGQRIRHYEVRSENDPAYKDLPYLDLALGFQVYTREYTTDVAAAKAVLKPLGYYAKEGGWVYYERRGQERVLCQGWWRAAQATGHYISSLKGEQGYRAVVTTALQVKVKVKVGA